MKHAAIFKLNPTVVTIADDRAFDARGEEVIYDKLAVETELANTSYVQKRAKEYPDMREYLDAIVKNDSAQLKAYIDKCKAVKAKYPKP